MPMKRFDKETFRREYNEKCPNYERLARNLVQAFKTFLEDAGIDILGVVYRIKEFDSFCDKIQRKGYKNPFQEIEDICGLRIICYYPSDLKRITQIIATEFNVKESIDKATQLEPDRFGYRSLHFVLTVKKDWLKAPNYRGLNGLKAEVQVRTILSHAWADIEHKLAYKKTEHVPDRFKRKLSQLSALFEVADEQFDILRKEREEYTKQLVSAEVVESGRFDVNQEMNLDSLQAFLDFYFPDRKKSIEWTGELLDEIIKFDVSIGDLVKDFEKTKDILPLMEGEEAELLGLRKGLKSAQVGAVRDILDLTNNEYEKNHRMPKEVRRLRKKWRAKLSKRNT